MELKTRVEAELSVMFVNLFVCLTLRTKPYPFGSYERVYRRA